MNPFRYGMMQQLEADARDRERPQFEISRLESGVHADEDACDFEPDTQWEH